MMFMFVKVIQDDYQTHCVENNCCLNYGSHDSVAVVCAGRAIAVAVL